MPTLLSEWRRVNLLPWLLFAVLFAFGAAYMGITSEGLGRTQFMLLGRAIAPLLVGACLFCLWRVLSLYRGPASREALAWAPFIAGWAWCLFVGAGGIGILFLEGPWPPTHGWFALASGLAACPLVGRLFRNSARLNVSGGQQFAAAMLIIAFGRLALTVWPQPHPL